MSFPKLVNFEKKEWIKDPNMVSPELALMVDELTSFVKSQMPNVFCIIHVAYEKEDHVENSKHYTGKAVDLSFHGMPLLMQYMAASMYPFTGIGVYPFWRNQGLHLELDPEHTGRSKRWWRDGNGIYKSMLNPDFAKALLTSAVL